MENNTTTTTALRVCYPSGSKHLGLGSPRYLVRSDMAEASWQHHRGAPRPSRGDYYQATSHSTIRLRAYWTSPRQSFECLRAFGEERIEPRSVVGPVHACDTWGGFVSIQVPHPNHSDHLVWINIWAFQPHPANFAFRIADDDVREWHDAGWQDIFLDGNGGVSASASYDIFPCGCRIRKSRKLCG